MMGDVGRGSANQRRRSHRLSRVEVPPYAFWQSRSGSGTPVVLIHGLGGSSDWWRHNIPELEATHTVAAVDLVGFGRNRFFLRRSSLPPTFEEMAALLARWIEASFGGPVHLVGNSMGGQIAIHLAAARPDLVRSLVLVNSTGIPFELRPGVHIENLMIPRGMLSFAGVLARDAFRSGPTALLVAFQRLLRDDARPLMRRLRMPVLLLWGERDPLVPLTYARRMLHEIPSARLSVVPSAGHVPMWENPEAFNGELLAFLGEVDRRSASPDREGVFTWGLGGWTEGIAHREAGRRRDVVLVHGLGMSSAYFVNLARALYERGYHAIAPDLLGFGKSVDGPPAGPREHARVLREWAETNGIRDAIWIGHSLGGHAVAEVSAGHGGMVRVALYLSPLWSDVRRPAMRLARALLRDAFREPWSLYPIIARSYWRAGFRRWFGTFRLYYDEMHTLPALLPPFRVMAGKADPLVDRKRIVEIDPEADLAMPGAHAMHFSDAEATADDIDRFIRGLA
jgi:pimeloyl-ACP methyl ester carboxylesterase